MAGETGCGKVAGRVGGSRDYTQEPDPEKRSVKLRFVIIGSPAAPPGRGRQGEDQEQGKGQLLEGATPGPGKARIIATVYGYAWLGFLWPGILARTFRGGGSSATAGRNGPGRGTCRHSDFGEEGRTENGSWVVA